MHRRRFLGSAGLALGGLATPASARPTETDWPALAADVKAEMKWAWAQYRRRAWGYDQIKPVTGGGQHFLLKGQSVGLSIVEALDTLWLMGLDAEVEDGVRWLRPI